MKPPACPICNYNLQGLGDDSRKCPECGNPVHIDPVEIRARMRDRYYLGVNNFVIFLLLLLLILLAPVLLIGASLELPMPPMLFLVILGLGILAVIVITEIYNSKHRKQPRAWDLVLTASEEGVQLRSAAAPDEITFEITWRRLQWIRCKRFHSRPMVRLEETFGSLAKWIELDCSWEIAWKTCKNLNWFRHATANTRPSK